MTRVSVRPGRTVLLALVLTLRTLGDSREYELLGAFVTMVSVWISVCADRTANGRAAAPFLGEATERILPIKHSKLFYITVLALAPQLCLAQTMLSSSVAAPGITPDAAASSSSAAAAFILPVQKPSVSTSHWQTRLDRWLDIDDLAFSFRYRKEVANFDYTYFHNGQQKSLIDGQFKFDPAGRYAVRFDVSSGRVFNWAYTDVISDDYNKLALEPAVYAAVSPAQLQAVYASFAADPAGYPMAQAIYSRGWAMSFRQLYFHAAPIKQVALEYGSLGIEKGVSTEATTYDDDGYITGERVLFFDPKHLFFDQVSFTNAYEGDVLTPSFFERGERLKEANYRQVLAAKTFGKRLQTSADYTFDKGTHTTREAALVKAPELKVVDSVRLELYQRLNAYALSGQTFEARQGFAFTGTKTFYKRFQLDGGYAHIDYDYGVLTGDRLLAAVGFSMNGDSYLTGNRAFARANWKPAPGVSFYGYYTHMTSTAPPSNILFNKEGLNGGMTIDLKGLLTKAKVM